jgi:type VI secretion system protein ImpL
MVGNIRGAAVDSRHTMKSMTVAMVGVVLAVVWAVCFLVQWPLWPAAMATGVAAVALGAIAWRRRRSARRLEAVVLAPDHRPEVAVLRAKMREGIRALKGRRALQSLPWYAIIGPPGAGKTTALRHSGLVFPHSDGPLPGVGGTRNCDWWFTTQGILLDTAGRYTERGDEVEWLAFLDALREHRSGQPLNGLIVAVSAGEVADAGEAELEALGKRLRGRVDEVIGRLGLVLPVYFLLTKCDLLAGFAELHGSLRKSERSQPWGATIALDENRDNPGALFAREFDLLVGAIHGRACKRMAGERNRRAREAIFQFPIELAGMKQNLAALLGHVFAPNPFQATPLFRGFYFSSGTQEGLPLARAVGRMRRAMGVAPAHAEEPPRTEPKSYFLHDVFTRVIFPDAALAGRSAAELRRRRRVRLGAGALAIAAGLALALPSANSFWNNLGLLDTSRLRASKAAKIDWQDGRSIRAKLDQLDPLLDRIAELDRYEDDVPFGYDFFMYSGREVHRPLARVYVKNLQESLVKATKLRLEQDLSRIDGKRYYADREKLKTYLMLGDTEHLDVEYATGQYTALWAEAMKAESDLGITELKKRLRPHVAYYFSLLRPSTADDKKAKLAFEPVVPNEAIVARARAVLQSVPVSQRYTSLFVDVLEYELYDPAEGAVRGNRQFPPFSLDLLFHDRPEVLRVLGSKQNRETGRYFEVPGPYTDKGHYAVLQNIDNAAALLASEEWVVPLTNEERGSRIADNVKRLADDYEQRYTTYWRDFLLDLEVERPGTLRAAVELYAELQNPEWPYIRLLRALEDHTQWKKDFGVLDNAAAQKILVRKLRSYASQKTGGLRINPDLKSIAGRATRVPGAFALTVSFKEGPLQSYMEGLGKLNAEMMTALAKSEDASPNEVALGLAAALGDADKLLAGKDDMARRLLEPLLRRPLEVGGG